MTATTLDREIGVDALVVDVAGVELPGAMIGAVTIRHGRSNPTSRPEPASLSVVVDVAALPQLPAIGQNLTVRLGDDAAAAFGLAGDELTAARDRFVGTITDLTLRPSGRPGRRSLLSIVAVSRRQRLARLSIGDTPWPAESDGARAGRILTLAGAAGLLTWGGADSSDPAGWFGDPSDVISIDAEPAEGAVKLRWKSIGPYPYAYRVFVGLVAGKTYTIRAEVQPRGVLDGAGTRAQGVATVEGPTARPGLSSWQTVVSTFVYPGGDGSQAIAVYCTAPVKAHLGSYSLVRELTLFESDEPLLGDIDPGRVGVLARDVDRQPALSLLDALAVDSGSELVELRDGRMEWHQSDRRRNVDPVAELAGAQVLAGVEWQQSVGDVVNDVTVVYGDPRDEIRIVDDVSIAEHGRTAVKLDTQLAGVDDAQTLAQLLAGRQSTPSWRMSQLEVDLTRTLAPAVARALLGVEFGALLSVTGFPTTAPAISAKAWVEGWTETITAKGWRLRLALSDYARSGPLALWADVPAGITWADLPALSWLGATAWRPPEAYAGRWLDLPTDLRWNEAGAGSWTTYTPED